MYAGVGHADADDAADAGKAAAEQALNDAEGSGELGIVFGSSQYDQETLLRAINDTLDMRIIGCSTGGEITANGESTGSVAVLVLDADDMDISIGTGTGISEDERDAGQQAAQEALSGLDEDVLTVRELRENGGAYGDSHTPVDITVFSTTLTGNASEVMRGVQDVVGEGFQAAGGLAGDDWDLDETYVYRDGEVLTDAIIVAAIDAPYRRSVGIRHGLEKTEHTYTVTDAEENVVNELDGRSAVEVYTDIYGKKGRNPQFLMTKPIGIEVGEEEPRLRDPLIVNDDGSIVFAGEVQEGSLVTIMDAPKDAVIDGARAAARDAYKNANEPDDVKAVLLNDCVCRWHCLENSEQRREEVKAVQEIVGKDTPVIGWYTYGEIALPRSLAGVHNQTLVAQLFTGEKAE